MQPLQKGDLDSLRALVALGASVNILNQSQHTPYDTALYVGAMDVAKFLKQVGGMKGVDVDSMNSPKTKKPKRLVEDGVEQVGELAAGGGKWCENISSWCV